MSDQVSPIAATVYCDLRLYVTRKPLDSQLGHPPVQFIPWNIPPKVQFMAVGFGVEVLIQLFFTSATWRFILINSSMITLLMYCCCCFHSRSNAWWTNGHSNLRRMQSAVVRTAQKVALPWRWTTWQFFICYSCQHCGYTDCYCVWLNTIFSRRRGILCAVHVVSIGTFQMFVACTLYVFWNIDRPMGSAWTVKNQGVWRFCIPKLTYWTS